VARGVRRAWVEIGLPLTDELYVIAEPHGCVGPKSVQLWHLEDAERLARSLARQSPGLRTRVVPVPGASSRSVEIPEGRRFLSPFAPYRRVSALDHAGPPPVRRPMGAGYLDLLHRTAGIAPASAPTAGEGSVAEEDDAPGPAPEEGWLTRLQDGTVGRLPAPFPARTYRCRRIACWQLQSAAQAKRCPRCSAPICSRCARCGGNRAHVPSGEPAYREDAPGPRGARRVDPDLLEP
jgi:hypothetical protein